MKKRGRKKLKRRHGTKSLKEDEGNLKSDYKTETTPLKNIPRPKTPVLDELIRKMKDRVEREQNPKPVQIKQSPKPVQSNSNKPLRKKDIQHKMAKEKAIKFDVPFSMENTREHSFYKCDGLGFTFVDDYENIITISTEYDSVWAIKWESIETLMDGEENNSCHIIENSSWVAHHEQDCVLDDRARCRHYKINFKDRGQLEFISIGFMVCRGNEEKNQKEGLFCVGQVRDY